MPPSAEDIRKALKAAAPTLQRSLVGSVAGATAGAGTGALLGAATSRPGERTEGAKQWARRGAVYGGISGALRPIVKGGLTFAKGRYVAEQDRQIAKLYEEVGSIPTAQKMKFVHDRILPVEANRDLHMEQYQRMLAPTPYLEVARQATIGGGIGTSTRLTLAKLRDFVVSRLQSRSASPPATSATAITPEEKTAHFSDYSSVALRPRVTLTKSANDPLAPDKGEPLQYETSQDRKARRVAELLKRAMPTGTAEGSASPTPKRGTP